MINDHDDLFDFKNEGAIQLSYNLLYLLQWLIQHESDTLRTIISKAVQAGYKNSDDKDYSFIELHVSDPHIYQSIINFLDLMDSLLIESEQLHLTQKGVDVTAIPAIKHIDAKTCGNDLVQKTLEHTSVKLKTNPDQNAKELLFKELLRRWKPGTKKTSMN